MSQHIFRTEVDGSPVEIQMGWDKPMQWFYLVLSPVDEEGELEDPIYSNLFEDDPKSLTLEYFLEVIRNFEIEIPQSMVDGVQSDRLANAVGRRIVYSL